MLLALPHPQACLSVRLGLSLGVKQAWFGQCWMLVQEQTTVSVEPVTMLSMIEAFCPYDGSFSEAGVF